MWVSSLGGFFHQHGIHSSSRSFGGVLSPSSLVMSSVAIAMSSEWGDSFMMVWILLIQFLAPTLLPGIQMAVGKDDLKVSGKLSVGCSPFM